MKKCFGMVLSFCLLALNGFAGEDSFDPTLTGVRTSTGMVKSTVFIYNPIENGVEPIAKFSFWNAAGGKDKVITTRLALERELKKAAKEGKRIVISDDGTPSIVAVEPVKSQEEYKQDVLDGLDSLSDELAAIKQREIDAANGNIVEKTINKQAEFLTERDVKENQNRYEKAKNKHGE